MYIEIDKHSGFCYGVMKTIDLIENIRTVDKPLNCLGPIVHNNAEIERLTSLGIKFIDLKDLEEIHDDAIVIRTHGEPASTYELIEKNQNICYDGTCPIVKTLQKKVYHATREMNKVNGQVVLFGDKNHAEVIGIVGQHDVNVIVVEKPSDLDQLNFKKPISLFSQTTKPEDDYHKIGEIIRQRMLTSKNEDNKASFLKIYESICNHVSKRAHQLAEFAKKFEIIIFMSGKNSSNGKVLFDVCKNHNVNSHWVSLIEEIDKEWFTYSLSVGICGATSTPRWQLQEALEKIMQLSNEVGSL